METKLNIAEILKDKPSGTKLYANAFGELSLERVKVNEEDIIHTRNKISTLYLFYNDGKFSKDGEPILVPSKEMRDWSKFAWKKGDILVSNDGKSHVIFSRWYDDNYTSFYGKHYLNKENKNTLYYKVFVCTTEIYSLEDKDAAKSYINAIEEKLGGKLDLKTLEIKKTQLEFKDGETEYQFKPFEKVLVRDTCNDIWKAAFFSHIKCNDSIYKYMCNCLSWKQCIPYEGNESLLGTTKDVEE